MHTLTHAHSWSSSCCSTRSPALASSSATPTRSPDLLQGALPCLRCCARCCLFALLFVFCGFVSVFSLLFSFVCFFCFCARGSDFASFVYCAVVQRRGQRAQTGRTARRQAGTFACCACLSLYLHCFIYVIRFFSVPTPTHTTHHTQYTTHHTHTARGRSTRSSSATSAGGRWSSRSSRSASSASARRYVLRFCPCCLSLLVLSCCLLFCVVLLKAVFMSHAILCFVFLLCFSSFLQHRRSRRRQKRRLCNAFNISTIKH